MSGFGSDCRGQDLGQNAQGWIWVGVYRAGFGSDCTGHDLGQTAQCRIRVRLHRAGSGSDCTGSGLSHNDVRLGHEDLGQIAQGRTWVRSWLRLLLCLVRVWVTCLGHVSEFLPPGKKEKKEKEAKSTAIVSRKDQNTKG